MKALRQAFRFFAVGALLGGVAATLAVPSVVRAFHVRSAAMCECAELADGILTTVWSVQGSGAGVGGLLGIVLWVILRRKGKLKNPL